MELARNIVNQEGKSVIMVVHDLNMALHYSDHIILMHNGTIIAQGTPAEVLTSENIRIAYDVRTKLESCGYINPFINE
jgi:iron complex transport system ATP-binding protein